MKIIRNTKRCSSSGKLPQRILKKNLTYENPDAGPHRNDWCLALVGGPHVLLILTDFLFSFSLSLFLNKFRKANVLVNRKTAFFWPAITWITKCANALSWYFADYLIRVQMNRTPSYLCKSHLGLLFSFFLIGSNCKW